VIKAKASSALSKTACIINDLDRNRSLNALVGSKTARLYEASRIFLGRRIVALIIGIREESRTFWRRRNVARALSLGTIRRQKMSSVTLFVKKTPHHLEENQSS
jgi:hypothetical protein